MSKPPPPFLRLVRESPSKSTTETTSDPIIGDDVHERPSMESPAVSVITVNPGQRISLISDVSADRVSFRCLPPGVEEPIVDPGIGAPGSVLKRVDERTVRAHIDTRGMSSGEGWWYLLGEDDEHPEKQVAELGRFIVRGRAARTRGAIASASRSLFVEPI